MGVLHNMGGDEWEDWYRAARNEIVSHQARTGSSRKGADVRGSWHPAVPPGQAAEKSDIAGRLYLAVMCVLILETPYRHVSVYEVSEPAADESPDAGVPATSEPPPR